MKIKNLFISDVHLGSRHASTTELLDFLNEVYNNQEIEKIYIIGDFIDGWKLKKNWFWNNESNLILRKILGFLRKNTEIFYIAGNHDEFLRIFIEDFKIGDFGSVHIGNEFIHTSKNNRRMLVIHGDFFDFATKYARWLCVLGDLGYTLLLRMNSLVLAVRKKLKMKHWSLSKAIKHNVKKTINYISDYENAVIGYAKNKNCDGCLCGHIHTAELRLIDGFLYANTGDWVESCTAVLEDEKGHFYLYSFREKSISNGF